MAVYKRGTVYWIDFVFNGKRYRRPAGGDHKEATKALARIKGRIASGDFKLEDLEPVEPKEETGVDFGAALKLYMESRLDAGKSAESYIHLQAPQAKKRRVKDGDRVETWGRVFAGRRVASITPGEVEETVQRWRAERGWSAATRNLAVLQLSGLFTYCVRRGWITSNPASAARIERLPVSNARQRWLTAAEIETLAVKAEAKEEPWLAPIIRFGAMSGMRLGELCNLRRADYRKDEAGEPVLVVAKTKNGDPHVWPVEGDARVLLDAQLSGTTFPGDRLFPGPGGASAETAIKRALPSIVKAAGMRYGRRHEDGITFHTLRHSMATLAYLAGARDAEVQRLGNWRTHRMMERYRKVADSTLRDAARKLATVVTLAGRSHTTVTATDAAVSGHTDARSASSSV